MTKTKTPTETDCLRFVVALCSARDDENLVKHVIESELADWPEYLHSTYLQVTLRVVVAQLYGGLARRFERDMPGLVDLALQAQAAQNEAVERRPDGDGRGRGAPPSRGSTTPD